MKEYYLKYRVNENIEINLESKCFCSILGNNNSFLLENLLSKNPLGNIFVGEMEINEYNIDTIRRRMSFVLYKHLDIFLGETVRDEIAYSLESLSLSKDDINNLIASEARNFNIEDILDKDPYSLGISDKVKIKILSSIIIKPSILVIENIISELDYLDKVKIINILKEYVKFGGIVINFTNNIEETLYGSKIIIINNMKKVLDDKTIKVLDNEKTLKSLGLGLPTIIELNKYLMDYGLISKYYLTNKSLVGALWK